MSKTNPFHTARDRLDHDLINIGNLDFVKVDLKYNGSKNFMNTDLYCGFSKAYLHKDAYKKILIAGEYLKSININYKFLVFDALRPRSVQRQMHHFVKNTPMESYVADPEKGSLHNFGMAIDLTLIDENKLELDMGTAFDDFTECAQPKLEKKLLASGKLNPLQLSNRLLLRAALTESGFEQLPHEWWHYNAFPAEYVRTNYKIIE